MILNFKEWLLIKESKYSSMRPDMDIIDTKKEEVSIGDIVELGPETQLKGTKVGRIGRVVEKRSFDIIVQDLTRTTGKRYIIPTMNFHDKEDLKGRTLLPKEEKELRLLGGKKLWVVLTPRQYKKFKFIYREPELPKIIPSSSTSDEPSKALKSMFARTGSQNPEPTSPLFKKSQGHTQPLKRFIKKSSLDSLLRRNN